MRDLNEDNVTDAVLARLEGAADPRFRTVMTALVRQLHGFVREVELTPEERERGIRVLTETGHSCVGDRQEFILLSGVLGVSILVDAIANRKPAGAPESSVLGPFWRAGAPEIPVDGPVDAMLRTMERHPYRPAHIHFIVSAEGRPPLVTQAFVEGNEYLDSDVVFGVKDSLVGTFRKVDDPAVGQRYGISPPFAPLEHDFALSAAA